MQILIIGSKGFIGSHLVSHFNSDNQNNVFGCDIIEDNGPKYFRVDKFESSYETILKSHTFDVCIYACLLYTSDAADERSSVDLGGRRIIKKKTNI